MRIYLVLLVPVFSTVALADTDTPTAAQQPTRATIAIEIDPEVIVMDLDDTKKLAEDIAARDAQAAAAVQPTATPRAPETRVIELDPPPVAIVNRTNQFRIISRRPAERTVAAPDNTEEAAEE